MSRRGDSLRPTGDGAEAATRIRALQPWGWPGPSPASAPTPRTDEETEVSKEEVACCLEAGASAPFQSPPPDPPCPGQSPASLPPSLAQPQATLKVKRPSSRLPGWETVTVPAPFCCFLNVYPGSVLPPFTSLAGGDKAPRKKKWTAFEGPGIGAGGLCPPASQESAENSPKLQRNLQNQERGGTHGDRAGWRGVSAPAYLRACLKLCNIHLMGKFEKNSTGFVLVKLTLRIFSSCLGPITLRSRDRRDRLTVPFVIWRMGRGR